VQLPLPITIIDCIDPNATTTMTTMTETPVDTAPPHLTQQIAPKLSLPSGTNPAAIFCCSPVFHQYLLSAINFDNGQPINSLCYWQLLLSE